jgi:hypothetical protein
MRRIIVSQMNLVYTRYDEETGKKYFHVDVTVYNNRPYSFPKVGSNGYLIFVLVGGGIIIMSTLSLYIKKRERKT